MRVRISPENQNRLNNRLRVVERRMKRNKEKG
jgi:hypothetical protein